MLNSTQRTVVATIIQALLYGTYLATLIQCFRWLLFTDDGWKPRGKITSLTMTFATIIIFLMSTIDIATSLQYAVVYLVTRSDQDLYGSTMASAISELLVIILIDCLMIYRCWIVYAKSWRIICVPAIFWLGSLACSALSSLYLALAFHGQTSLKSFQIEQWSMTGLYICNITTSIYTTTAIIYRIWYTKKTSVSSPKRLDYTMRILAESGMLYTSMTVFGLVGTVLGTGNDISWVIMFMIDISDAIDFSMAGIAFNLILIRVYNSRVEMRDSLADSRVHVQESLSGMQFSNPQVTEPVEGQSSKVPNEPIGEIQECRRSSDGIHEN